MQPQPTYILAITTFNRLGYLKELLNSWKKTRDNSASWKVIIADDGSTDGTLQYVQEFANEHKNVTLLSNQRVGVHQQMNTIIEVLEKQTFDVCFKVDDDIVFLQSGWDTLYHKAITTSGYEHLIFCDEHWCVEQQLNEPVQKTALIGKTSMNNAHGFFYTITPQMIKEVGYFDVPNFGFRGMGHVDYSHRSGLAGFCDKQIAYDVVDSNNYISATKKSYLSAIDNIAIEAYDSVCRIEKEKCIANKKIAYLAKPVLNTQLYKQFEEQLQHSFKVYIKQLKLEKKAVEAWYKEEIEKQQQWFERQLFLVPSWLKSASLFWSKRKKK